MLRSLRALSIGLVAGLTLGSCGVFEPKMCTLIGCDSGLRIQVESAPVGAYKVEVLNSSGAATVTFNCSGGGCVFIAQGYEAPSVDVRVTTTLGSRTTHLTGIVYTISNPNGDECPPVCKQGSVTAPIP